ncbi:MAG: tetratricopeptide repeat protein [Flavobacteriaceae bacterium]|jgi:tetratricopeptide (TPR) repeat protein
MKRKLIYFLLFSLTLGHFSNAQEQDPYAIFKQANEYYNQGQYEKAIEAYQRIESKDAVSAELYFNLGNSFYKTNKIAESIFYYEKALLLNPQDKEIRDNLGYAQNMRIDAIETIPLSFFQNLGNRIIFFLSIKQLSWLALLSVLFSLCAYILFRESIDSSRKRTSFSLAIVFLVIGLSSFGLSRIALSEEQKDRPAVLFGQEVLLRAEPNLGSEVFVTLHEGTKVDILEIFEDFSKIKLANGQTGWIEKDELKEIK